jgi:hypothetical protein
VKKAYLFQSVADHMQKHANSQNKRRRRAASSNNLGGTVTSVNTAQDLAKKLILPNQTKEGNYLQSRV